MQRPINDPETIREVMEMKARIAVIGLSPKPVRDSHMVARYLLEQGYDIIPVRPAVSEILGQRAWPSLDNVDDYVDIALVFRAPQYVPEIVEQAIKKKIRYLWLQQGVIHETAARRAQEAGIHVVMDKCLKVEHYLYHKQPD